MSAGGLEVFLSALVAAPCGGGLKQFPFILTQRSFGRVAHENQPFHHFFLINPRSVVSIEGSGAISEGSGTVSERSFSISKGSFAAPEGSEMISEHSFSISERSIAVPERSFGAFAHDFWSFFGRAILASRLAGCSST
jgi:hypothetical protein